MYRSPDGSRYAKEGGADLAGERDRIEWLSAQRIPGPSVLEWATTPDGPLLITSAVPGVPADQLDSEGLGRAWSAIAAAVRDLHALPTVGCPFSRELAAMATLARDAVNPDFLPDEDRARPATELLCRVVAELPQRLGQEAGDLVVCHGDLCLPNIVIAPGDFSVAGFIDLGRLGLADRHADLALLFANARETWPGDGWVTAAAHERFLNRYGAPADPERLAFYLRLDPLTWG
ncbi:APH(3'') family aminoglycoside O-phosphotransferase [Mycobacteroides abscessus]|nr:APH(3'') family aminoglycoside O-phosphotransferase [Mycobacteroides abscessus subsp. massiliense]OTQ95126.1 APH(3'') family aminoglycoside O-phosphotransferase [Mycobacteroides abscessus]ORA87350.1 APH(3'') family aminoglycoside O-phosphotransferase [Mycobacteroides abscessus subsp. massiliense]OTQ99425.1 APH(3'') family aminoglycoside O-phosphotransferase [Mycobacteroides abscessus]OTR05851.1 APH(3'') family aminoglycoside O-phosphotransferase [Mycobacteroides abscessus]